MVIVMIMMLALIPTHRLVLKMGVVLSQRMMQIVMEEMTSKSAMIGTKATPIFRGQHGFRLV